MPPAARPESRRKLRRSSLRAGLCISILNLQAIYTYTVRGTLWRGETSSTLRQVPQAEFHAATSESPATRAYRGAPHPRLTRYPANELCRGKDDPLLIAPPHRSGAPGGMFCRFSGKASITSRDLVCFSSSLTR